MDKEGVAQLCPRLCPHIERQDMKYR
jgi:hypothetical protein